MAGRGRDKSEARCVADGGISNTVKVQGFSTNTSQEVLEMYFENSRRSGGGDLEEVQIEDDVIYITFKETEVAQRVVSHNHHQVDGQTLTVTLFHTLPPKPCYKNRVLIQGLNNAVTEELLRNFLETVTEAKVRECLYGEEEGNVLVTLSDNIDIGQLRKTFQERRIEGAVLKVSRVDISNCILVHNVQLSTSHDAVLFYFENKRRSDGGDVEKVEMKAEDGYCLVYFEDYSVIDRVLSKSHNIDGIEVEVHLHHECLGRRSSRNKSDPLLRMPSPGNKDIAILAMENKENQVKDETSSSVSSNPEKESDFIEVQEWQENDGKNCVLPLWIKYKRAPEMKIIKCIKNIPCSWNFHVYWNFCTKAKLGQQILNETVSKYNCSVAVCIYDEDLFIFEISDKSFEQESDVVHYIHDVLDSVHKCAQQFLYFDTLLVDQRIQGEVIQIVKQREELDGAMIELMGQQDHDAIYVICTEKDKISVLHIVTEIIQSVKECFENHEEIIYVDHKWQKVMKTFGYIQKLGDEYPKITIMLDKSKSAIMLKGARDQSKPAIMLKGPRDQCKATADHLMELVGKAQSEVKEDIFSPGCQFDIFTYPEMCEYIDNIISELSIAWIPDQLTKKIHIFSKKMDKIKSIDKTIKGCVQERAYPLSGDQSVPSPELSSSLEELKKKYVGKIVVNPSSTGLLVTTADDIFESVDAAVQKMISKQTGSFVDPKTPYQSSGARPKRNPTSETPDQQDSLTIYHDFKIEVAKEVLDLIRDTGGEKGVLSLVTDLRQKVDVDVSNGKVIISLDGVQDPNFVKTCVRNHYQEAKKESKPSQDATRKHLIEGGNADTKELLHFAYSRKDWDKILTVEGDSLYLTGALELKKEIEAAVQTVNQWAQKDLYFDPNEQQKATEAMSCVRNEFPAVFIRKTYDRITIKGDNVYTLKKAKRRAKVTLGRTNILSRRRRCLQTDIKSISRLPLDDRKEESTASHPSDLQTFQHSMVTTSKTYYTREGIIVKVYIGDIVRLPVDCIVNGANQNLSHGGGVSLAIAKAAGREFHQEREEYVRRRGIIPVTQCYVTSAGRLPYKRVIHAVGPQWHDYKPNETDRCGDDLKKTIVNCLIQANSLTMTSIAIPSISSGIFGVPNALCAQMYVKGVIEFSRTCTLKSDSVKEIHFVDTVSEMCLLTQLAFDAEFNTSNDKETVVGTKQSQMKDMSARRQELPPVKTQNESSAAVRLLSYAEAAAKDQGTKQIPYVIKSGDHTRILIYNHDITDVAVDGIVCPVSPNMESGVAKSLKRACGSEYTNGDYKCVMGSIRREGETCVTKTPTSRPNLPFQHIIHVYSPCWPDLEQHKHRKNLKQQIEKSVTNVFAQAIKYKIPSVAFPVLGIGDKTTPVKTIWEYMMDGIATVYSNPHMAPVRQMTIHLVTNETSLTHHLKEIACQQFGQKFDASGETLQNAYGYVVLSDHAKQSHIKAAVMNDTAFSVTQREPDPGSHLHGSKRAQRSHEESFPICKGTPVAPKAFNECGHVFCRECMEFTVKKKPVCPVCGKIYGITGNQPKGTMNMRITSSSLPGFKNCGTIEILYSFPGGIQTEEHPNPGKPYQETSKCAYLPDNKEGLKVLSLLKKAFERRLVFTIGQSVTKGAENIVTWNDIHHKINKDGGPQNYGYPDPGYLRRVQEELAAKGITKDT